MSLHTLKTKQKAKTSNVWQSQTSLVKLVHRDNSSQDQGLNSNQEARKENRTV